jgi:hypothetical protein
MKVTNAMSADRATLYKTFNVRESVKVDCISRHCLYCMYLFGPQVRDLRRIELLPGIILYEADSLEYLSTCEPNLIATKMRRLPQK